MARWRELVGATVVAVVSTAVLAVTVGAASTTAPTGPDASPVAAVTTATGPDLPEVVAHPIDPETLQAVRSSAPEAAQSVTQVVQLTIVGGALALASPSTVVVELDRAAASTHEWVGVLPPVRVVDARGTHAGWSLQWVAQDATAEGTSDPRVRPERVRLSPGALTVVAGEAHGIAAGGPSAGGSDGATLLRARAGSGGGTYEAGATVSMRLPGLDAAERITVTLAFTVD